MAIDGMWQVFKLQKSTSRNDFCRIAAKNGILLRLINTLYSLNEATRLASIASGGGFATDGLSSRPRSDALDSNIPFTRTDSAFYGSDLPDHLKVKPGDHMSQTGSLEPARASVSHSPESRFIYSDAERPQSSISSLDALGGSRVTDPASLDRLSNSAMKDHLPTRDRESVDRWKNDPSRNEDNLKQQRGANVTGGRISMDRAPKSMDVTTNGSSAHTGTQQENVRPLLSLLDKEPPSRHFSGQLEYVKHLTGMEKHESILPLLHGSNDKKTNGLDFLMAEFAG